MFLNTPVGRKYQIDGKECYFSYLQTVSSEEDRDSITNRLLDLGFQVQYERVKSKKHPNRWNIFSYNPDSSKVYTDYARKRRI